MTRPSLKALVTVAELATYAGQVLENLSAEQQAGLQRLINAVSRAMEGHCGTVLVKEQATEYYDGGQRRIVLRRVPADMSAAITVLEDGTALERAEDGSSKTAGGSEPDYWLDPGTGFLDRNGIWLRGRRVIAVTYTAGLLVQKTTGDVIRTSIDQELAAVEGPEDVREACLIICKAHTDLGPTNFGVQFLDGGRVLRADAWPRTALEILDYYRYPG